MKLTADKVVEWTEPSAPAGVSLQDVYFGPDPFGLGGFQVAVAVATAVPSKQALRDLFASRKGKTAIQLVVAIEHGDSVHMFGPDPQAQPIEVAAEQAERQLQSVLSEPDALAATERFAGFLKSNDSTGANGFTNSGLFATHHIAKNVPKRTDWETLGNKAQSLLTKRGKQLVDALGFKTQPGPNGTMLLSVDDHPPRAVAVLLDNSEQFDAKSQKFQLSPVAFGLAVTSKQEIPWLIVLRKDQIRLYPGQDAIGLGSNGQAETYFEVDLSTIDADHAALLPLIFSSGALKSDGTIDELLRDSSRYATELGARLRERIYDEIIPPLAVEVAQRLAEHAEVKLDTDGLALSYRVTLRILFRLLFQAYAEDRDLLPSGRNEGFDANSLNANAHRLLNADPGEFGESSTIWFDLVQVWSAVDQGNAQWQIPPYNGGLFSTDPKRSPEGALIKQIELPDRVLGPALKSLLVDVNEEGELGAVDFQSLSVREFGSIYEGLLESSLSLAEENLTVDDSGVWVPAKESDEVFAVAGSVYFHTASGERKSTGSYFTPKVIVDHLIERSIVPTLETHLERIRDHLEQGDAPAASRDFFDFRVADLAMGSGHFLVAAVDKIEALMRTFLTDHSVPGVTAELGRLAEIAREALGTDDVAKSEVDEVGLLRRQVARRCIYGLDVNPMAVELARLALWIHTFVPGLPMSNLDHGLVNANSLTGVGTIDEALDDLQPERTPGAMSLFDEILSKQLASSRDLLIDVANASEANKAEVEEGARVLSQAREAADTARQIFDAAVATRMGRIHPEHVLDTESLEAVLEQPVVAEVGVELEPAHMPYLFPEVFLRDNPGFDVIIGNPPWEEVKPEERSFWLRYRPGLFGLSDSERVSEIDRLREERPELLPVFEKEKSSVERYVEALRRGPFPGMGTGDPDLYKAFSWRNWQLLRKGGATAFVGPRTLLNTAGSQEWRKRVFEDADSEILVFINSGRWAFDMEPRYSVALISTRRDTGTGMLRVGGPFHSRVEFDSRGQPGTLSFAAISKATKEASIPAFDDASSANVFEQIRRAPRLDEKRHGWDFRPVSEFHATNDRKFYDTSSLEEGGLPVWGGDGYNIWVPETGEVKAFADAKIAEAELLRKRKNQIRDKRSAFFGKGQDWAENPETLSYRHPRIAFRGISQRTNQRTVISALIPGDVMLQNSSPFLFNASGNARDEAFLLGFLSSIPLDWYARTLIETNLNLFIFNGFPVPARQDDNKLHDQVIEISGRLAAPDDRFAHWAQAVEVPVGSVKTSAEKDDLVAELDAVVSLVYDLDEDQVEHIFKTFHRGWDFESRLDTVLKHFRTWKSEA
ncbi:MAG: hypothetical protein K1X67_15940 [Fimbriimonadaceae bacterium]|nr:hypothetical protein [Fimbriimonadaceae bacterium]